VAISDNITNRLVRLEGAFGRVFESAMDWAEQDFQSEIAENKWRWPNKTIRQNGQSVGSPRNIIDTGNLLQSQSRESLGVDHTAFTWTGQSGSTKTYALYVHDGCVLKNGRRIPARPFTDHAIQKLPDIVGALIAKEVASNG
jgi:hypothetical protein